MNINLRFKISKVVQVLLIAAIVLMQVCGFTFAQRYVNHVLPLSALAVCVYFAWKSKLRLKRDDLLLFLFLAFLVAGMVLWGKDRDKIHMILYASGMVLGGVYYICHFPEQHTMRIFKILFFFSMVEAASIFLSVAIPGLFPQFLGGAYREMVIERMRKELSKGIHSGYLGEKALAAYLLNLGIAYKLSFLYKKKKLDKKNLAEIIVLFVAILFTGKRLLLVSAAIMVVMSMLAGKSLSTKVKSIAAILAVCGAVYVTIQYVPAARVTFLRFADTENYETIGGRAELWDWSIRIFTANPLFGCGYGSYRSVSGALFEGHNSYLQLLAELGIVGCALLGSFIVITLFRALENLRCSKRPENYLALNIQVLTLFYAFTGNVFHTYSQIIPYFLSAAIIYWEGRRIKLKKVSGK